MDRNNNTTTVAVVIVVLALLIVGALVYTYATPDNGGGNGTNSGQNGGGTGTTTAGGGTSTSTVKAFTITGQNYSFSPSTITVNRGDRVKITFSNASGVHNLILDDFDVGTKVLQAGGSETIEFIANKTGSFEYYCSVGNHRAMGMKGALVVR